MSGHSKWSTIKRQKGLNDAKRGKTFTRLANAIIIAVKEGGGDAETNFKLRLVLDQARAANLPKENINRSIDKALGKGGGPALETITYEGYGPAATALVVETVTDNRNRTGAEVKSTIEKAGGSLGGPGAVSFLFEKKGVITINLSGKSIDELLLEAADLEADDVNGEDGVEAYVYTPVTKLKQVEEGLKLKGYQIEGAELDYVAKGAVNIEEEDKARSVLNLIDKLEDLEDVVKVSSNFEIPDEILQKIS